MKLNFKQTLKDFDGTPLKIQTEDGIVNMTLGIAIVRSLQASLQGDETIPPMDKVKLGMMGVAVNKGLELPIEDVAKIKERICRVFASPVVAWALNEAIEGGAEPTGKK